MGFLMKDRDLPSMILCNNDLPWVKYGKHLGVKLYNTIDNIIGRDIIEKRAQYIQKNNELLQEFAYATGKTKFYINHVYNSSFFGSVLWDFHCTEADMIYNTWNMSVRRMFRLDRKTHRYFIEPVSEMKHLKTLLLRRFNKFIGKLLTTKKPAIKTVFKKICTNCMSTTGKNLRHLMLDCNKIRSADVTLNDMEEL